MERHNYPSRAKCRTFKKKIEEINKKLIAANLEPITYSPIKAGYLENDEILPLSLTEDLIINIFFPYEDGNFEVTPHEVTYHLAPILFSKKVTDRIRAISLPIEEFSQIVEKSKILGQKGLKLASILRANRGNRIDVGSGNLFSFVARAKAIAASKLGKYANNAITNKLMGNKFYADNDLQIAFSQLAEPGLPPTKVLVESVLLVVGNLKGVAKKSSGAVLQNSEQLTLTDHEAQELTGLLNEYIKSHNEYDEGFKPQSAISMFVEFKEGLDKRVDEILSVLD